MSGVICPHCKHDNYKTKADLCDLPWEDGDDRKTTCNLCRKTFWIATVTTVEWFTYPNEEEYDNR
jgi:transposase-like protein